MSCAMSPTGLYVEACSSSAGEHAVRTSTATTPSHHWVFMGRQHTSRRPGCTTLSASRCARGSGRRALLEPELQVCPPNLGSQEERPAHRVPDRVAARSIV